MDSREQRYQNYLDRYSDKVKKRAEEYTRDPKKTQELIRRAKIKAERKRGPLHKIWDKMQLLLSITRDYARGQYREIPFASIVLIVIGIFYFVSPIDAIIDILPILGYVDDASVLGLIIAQVNTDLEKYRQWKQENHESN